MSRSALVLGATGLVGGHCLQMLLHDAAYERVVAFVRKPLPLSHPKLETCIVDFDQLERHAAQARAQEVFCCLGSTIKQAGSQAAFRKVDFEYPHQLAQLAARNGAEQFLLVSALGANAESSIFYNRVKGEVEAAIAALPFRAVHIFQPSLLLGERQETRRGERIGEYVFKFTAPLWLGPLRKYRPISAKVVAAAMVHLAQQAQPGIHMHESHLIQSLAQGL
ncbi:MAG: oxidoreductase [candidate division KSB1 bacterium]